MNFSVDIVFLDWKLYDQFRYCSKTGCNGMSIVAVAVAVVVVTTCSLLFNLHSWMLHQTSFHASHDMREILADNYCTTACVCLYIYTYEYCSCVMVLM